MEVYNMKNRFLCAGLISLCLSTQIHACTTDGALNQEINALLISNNKLSDCKARLGAMSGMLLQHGTQLASNVMATTNALRRAGTLSADEQKIWISLLLTIKDILSNASANTSIGSDCERTAVHTAFKPKLTKLITQQLTNLTHKHTTLVNPALQSATDALWIQATDMQRKILGALTKNQHFSSAMDKLIANTHTLLPTPILTELTQINRALAS